MMTLRVCCGFLAVSLNAVPGFAGHAIHRVDAETVRGKVVGLEGEAVVLEGDEGQRIPLSEVNRIVFQSAQSLTGTNQKATLSYRYFEGRWTNLPDFSALSPDASGRVADFSIGRRRRQDHFGFEFSGLIHLPRDGEYTFYTRSDDGSQLYIDAELVVDNDGLHGVEQATGKVVLNAGVHQIKVVYFEDLGDEFLEVKYSGPGMGKRNVAPGGLYRGVVNSESSRQVLLPRTNFNITSGSTRVLSYPIVVPDSTSRDAVLRFGIGHSLDNAGDDGLKYRLLDAKKNNVTNGFIKTKDVVWTEHVVRPRTRWMLVIEDDDTVFDGPHPGNVGSVEALLIVGSTQTVGRVSLVGNDRLSGTLSSWDADRVTVWTGLSLNLPIEVPITYVREIWLGPAGEEAEARRQIPAAVEEDIAYVSKGGVVHGVSGVCLGIRDGKLSFRYGDEDRGIALNRLVGVVFSPRDDREPRTGFYQTVHTLNGDILSGTWNDLKSRKLTMTTDWGEAATVNLTEVVQMTCGNGRQVYLSDLTPAAIEEVPFFDRVMHYRRDRDFTGAPIVLGGVTYDKGLATHSKCRLDYSIDGQFQRFRSRVGFEQPGGRLGHSLLRVIGDERVLWERLASGRQDAIDLDVDVRGVSQLQLEIDFAEREDTGDRILWADARLLRDRVAP